MNSRQRAGEALATSQAARVVARAALANGAADQALAVLVRDAEQAGLRLTPFPGLGTPPGTARRQLREALTTTITRLRRHRALLARKED